MSNRSAAFAVAAVVIFAAATPPLHAKAPPIVTKLKWEQGKKTVTAKIYGERFGPAPTNLPCVKCAINEMQVIYNTGNNEPFAKVTIKAWSDKYIELGDISAPAGTTVVFAVKDDTTGKTVAATADVPGGPPAPVIRRLLFFRDHKHLKIKLEGRGFGTAPPGVPGNTDIGYFQAWIWVTNGDVHNYPWSAGHDGDSVTLKFESWSDSTIVIGGFGDNYRGGSEDWTAHPGDAVTMTVFNNPGGGAFGPSTGRAARIP